MLASLGLLSSNKTDYATYAGGALLFAAVMLLMHLLLYRALKNNAHPCRYLLVIYLVMIVSYAICMVAKTIHLIYLAPLLLTGMLLSVSIGVEAALIANLSLSVLLAFGLSIGGHSTTSDIAYVLCSSLLAGSVSSVLLKGNIQRARILLIGALGALISFLVIIGVGIMVSSSIAVVMPSALYSLGGSLLSVLLSLGLQPVLEWMFNLPTQSRLLDLCNPTQPLLHQLITEAPGTYHHSLIIANLAEACAERIGANPLLARAGGYYHDIGKLKRPLYFKENQIGIGNVHDESSPAMSAAIITAHIRDGLAMAKQHRLPPELQDIISQHHGNSLVQYFFVKAKESGEEVNPEDYRYDGTPPVSKEAAIVMLCDTIEAAIRTLKSPTKDDIRNFVLKLIQGKIDDGQLENSSLSVRDLHLIADTCANVLYGVFHERIEYPDQQRRKKSARELLGIAKPMPAAKEAK
jgi:putative nucleotidyltransferase with HDIG domain